MRFLGNPRPYGNRLRPPTTVKIKALNVVPKAGDLSTATDGAGWGKMWSNFDWTGWIKAQIDAAQSQGATCVKVTGSGASADYPVSATFLTRAQQFLDYCVTQGLYVYWNYASTDWGGNLPAATTPLTNIAGLLDRYPNVVALDLVNEITSYTNGAQLTDMPGLLSVARNATKLPVTFSVNCKTTADLTNATVQAVCQSGVDFMDFHPYFTSGDPANTDWATFRGEPWFLPFLLGEGGQNLAAGGTAQTARWTALGNIAAASDCYGAVGFCIADYSATPSNQWGMYPSDFSTVRTQISTPFASWPSHQ